MKRLFIILSIACYSLACAQSGRWNEITYADPTIFAENGKYYMTGTY